MPPRIQVELDVDEIRQLVQQQAQAAGAATSPWRGALSRMVGLERQRMTIPPSPFRGPAEQLQALEIQVAQFRAQKSLENALREMQMQPWQRAMAGLQIGAGIGGGGGFAGVLGTLGQFGSLIGKVNPGLLAAGAAIGVFASAVGTATQTLTTFAQIGAATGGTPGQIGLAQGLAGAVGLQPGALGELAASLRQRIATTPMGRLAASELSIGFVPPRGIGVPPNEMAILLQMVERMRRLPESAARLTAERAPELTPFLALRYASEGAMNRMRALASGMDRMFTPEMTARAMLLNMELQNMKLQWQQLAIQIGGPVIGTLSQVLQGFTNVAQMFGLDGKQTEKPRSVGEQQLDELRKSRMTLEYIWREGTFGGGERASRAIPPGLRGQVLDQALRYQAIQLGAF